MTWTRRGKGLPHAASATRLRKAKGWALSDPMPFIYNARGATKKAAWVRWTARHVMCSFRRMGDEGGRNRMIKRPFFAITKPKLRGSRVWGLPKEVLVEIPLPKKATFLVKGL